METSAHFTDPLLPIDVGRSSFSKEYKIGRRSVYTVVLTVRGDDKRIARLLWRSCRTTLFGVTVSVSSGVDKGSPGGPGLQSSRRNISIRLNSTKLVNLVNLFSEK